MVARLLLHNGTVPVDHEANAPGELFPKVGRDSALAVGAIAGIIVGAVGAVVLALVILWWVRRKMKADSADDETFLENLAGLPPRFSYKDLQHATNNFEKILGGGGFGLVYGGTLPNGVKIAVKKLNRQVGSKDFRAEVAILGSIHHVNLVRLLGFCAQGPHRLLVYEFMPNGSLDKWIFQSVADASSNNSTPTEILDWSQRFNIAVGTARGLAYLHDECAKLIIHSDIKPQNILLDENLVAKVADFGLSKTSEDVSSESTGTTLRGTPGYVAPEWLLGLPITEKGDVYSYGLVMFELLGGRRNLDPSDQAAATYFPAVCLSEVRERGFVGRSLGALVDPRLNGRFDEQQAKRMLKVAFWCVQEDPESRPTMREVVLMLEGKLSISDPPSMRFVGLHQGIITTEREKLQRLAFGGDTTVMVETALPPAKAATSPTKSTFSVVSESLQHARVDPR